MGFKGTIFILNTGYILEDFMKAKHTLWAQLVALFLLALPMMPISAADLSPPQQAIDASASQMQIKMQDKGFIKDFSKVTSFVNEAIYPHVDFDRVGALVLGKHWKEATADERSRFNHEFQTLLVRTYSRAFVEFKEWSIRYLPLPMEAGTTKVIVKTEILQPGLQPIAVDYRMALHDGEWKAYDIMIEGVSLVTNYRSTFSNEIQTKGSLNAVIDGLAKRNAEALAENAGKKS
jgi:phospholipid transport system substrate-binding protein